MTKQSFKHLVLSAGLFLGGFSAAQANNIDTTLLSGTEPLAVNYLGNEDGYLVFEVTVANENGNATLAVSDQAEGQLYATTIRGDRRVQTVKIEKTADQHIDFTLQVNKKSYVKSFFVREPVALDKQ